MKMESPCNGVKHHKSRFNRLPGLSCVKRDIPSLMHITNPLTWLLTEARYTVLSAHNAEQGSWNLRVLVCLIIVDVQNCKLVNSSLS